MEDDRWIKEPDKKDKKNHSKFIIVVVLIGVALAALIALLHEGEPKVQALSLDKTSLTLGVDESDRLIVIVMPEKAQPELVWESSDDHIVRVTDGVVRAYHPGNAVVKVSVKDQQDIFAVCEYTVEQSEVDTLTLDILEDPLILRPGGHQQLTVKITPESPDEIIVWSSTNESVARVSPRGKVEALKVGFAYIIATSERTGAADTATVSVEGSGVSSAIATPVSAPTPSQTATTQPAPATTSKPTPAATSKSAPVTASKSTSTATSKSVPATTLKSAQVNASRSAQTAAAKPAPATTSKPTPAATSKSAPVTASKSTSAATSKSVPATTLKSAPVNVSKSAQTAAAKPAPVKNSKPSQTAAANPVSATTSKSVPATTTKATTTASSKPAPAKTAKTVAATATKSTGTKNLGYATYKGNWPDDVNGRMEFKTSHVIDSRDPKGRVAQPGDYVVGEWSEGHLVQGIWYGADNKAKGSILIGK